MKKSVGMITVKIDDEMEKKLRKEISKRSSGYRKGDMKKCIEEAIRLWMEKS